jgi:protein-S-isoprenylcysteine O-methyltransferase Ste14
LAQNALVQRTRAAIGSVIFLVIAPGVVAGLIPWWLTGWDSNPWWLPLRVAGGVLVVLGVVVLLNAFVRFVIEGVGTPAPVAPTERLVVGGLYRYVRNPMYLAVGATIAGQALLLGRPILFAELAVFAAAVVTFVRVYEEPHLQGSYGDEYDAYRREVPGWWPRRPSART